MKNLSIFQPCFGLPLMTCCTLHSVWVVSVIFKSVLHGNRHDIQQPQLSSQPDRYSASQAASQRASETLKMPWKRYLCTFFFIIFFSCLVVNCLSTIILLCCQHLNVIMPIILFYDSRNIFCALAHFAIFSSGVSGVFVLFFGIFGFFPRAVWNRSSFGRKIVGGSQCGLLFAFQFCCLLPGGSFRLFNVGLVEVSAAFRFRFSFGFEVSHDFGWDLGLDRFSITPNPQSAIPPAPCK